MTSITCVCGVCVCACVLQSEGAELGFAGVSSVNLSVLEVVSQSCFITFSHSSTSVFVSCCIESPCLPACCADAHAEFGMESR